MIWKNRDRGGGEPMEFRYWDQGPIPFIGYTSNNNLLECYGGVNAAGFAVANTDGHNFDNGPHNDGRVMWDALSKCRTIDDFQALLDSADQVDVNGRYGYNYQVLDAYGGCANIEAARFGHTRFDAADAPEGFLVRANFAYTGNMNLNDGTNGIHRHNRSAILFRRAVEEGRLTPQYILQTVARDISSIDIDPYPLPLRGYFADYPYGSVPNFASICRSTTSATLVVQGVPNGGRPDDCVTWAMIGAPLGGITTPLWVRAGSVPVEYDGPAGSRLNTRIIALRNYAYNNVGAVDTWKLTNPSRTGLWDFIVPLENWMFAKTERFLASPNFSYDRLRAFQDETAQQIADSIQTWKPTYAVTEVSVSIFLPHHIMLRWGQIAPEQIGGRDNPSGYAVYRSAEPFREGMGGELIGETSQTFFEDRSAPLGGSYYRVELVF